MKTKEAIELMCVICREGKFSYSKTCEIKELLKHLEKYEKMWEEHKEGIIFLSGDAHYKGAKILMERIEHKYFPESK